MQTVTDNWLFEDAGFALSGQSRPQELKPIYEVDTTGVREVQVSEAALHVLSLASLLEQVVLCEKIGVLGDWVAAWVTFEGFRSLVEENLVIQHSTDYAMSGRRVALLNELLQHPAIRAEYERNIQSRFAGHVTDGSASYLELAERTLHPYCPHPTRAKFLESTIWNERWPPQSLMILESKIESSRVKLQKFAGARSVFARLTCKIPSLALLCFRESSISATQTPVDVALQLRKTPGMGDLRRELSAIDAGLRSNQVEDGIRGIRRLDNAVREVERRLGVHDTGDISGPTRINVFGLPLTVPAALHAPVMPSRHTGIVQRLILAGAQDLSHVLAKSLGLRDRRVLQSLELVAGSVSPAA